MGRILCALGRLANEQRLFRRLALIWACTIITIVVLRATTTEALTGMGAAAASVVVAVIGILVTVVNFYQWHRQQDA